MFVKLLLICLLLLTVHVMLRCIGIRVYSKRWCSWLELAIECAYLLAIFWICFIFYGLISPLVQDPKNPWLPGQLIFLVLLFVLPGLIIFIKNYIYRRLWFWLLAYSFWWNYIYIYLFFTFWISVAFMV